MKKPLPLAVCFLVPLAVLLLGAIGGVVYAVGVLPGLTFENGRGDLPDGFEVELSEPGKYTVWLHGDIVEGVHGYRPLERLPEGAEVVLNGQPGNVPIALSPYTAASKSIGPETANSIGTFEIGTPTTVSVLGRGFPRPTVISVAPVKLGEVLRTVLTVVGIIVGSIVFALILLIVLLHRRKAAVEDAARVA